MSEASGDVRVRPLTELDIGGVVKVDERVTGNYRPQDWERRVAYYIRRDPEASQVAEIDGKVVGFMLAEIRAGEFGLEEPTGWVEAMGVDPKWQGKAIGRRLIEALFAHFREVGARKARTIVENSTPDIAAFFQKVGFGPAPLTSYEMDL